MMPGQLNLKDRLRLLELARQALEQAVRGKKLTPLKLEKETDCLQEIGASFITLTRKGELRGCIGTLEASIPLAEDVREHAAAAALQDFRFPSVTEDELSEIEIEISCLTAPMRLEYADQEDLLCKLRPELDGVILKKDNRRATFLPQVWKKVPSPEDFLSYLCHKLGEPPDAWMTHNLEVWVYQVEEFHE